MLSYTLLDAATFGEASILFPEETLGKISYVECFPSIFAFLLSNAASISVTCCETKGRRSTVKAEIRVINVNLTNANRKELWNLFGTKKLQCFRCLAEV